MFHHSQFPDRAGPERAQAGSLLDIQTRLSVSWGFIDGFCQMPLCQSSLGWRQRCRCGRRRQSQLTVCSERCSSRPVWGKGRAEGVYVSVCVCVHVIAGVTRCHWAGRLMPRHQTQLTGWESSCFLHSHVLKYLSERGPLLCGISSLPLKDGPRGHFRDLEKMSQMIPRWSLLLSVTQSTLHPAVFHHTLLPSVRNVHFTSGLCIIANVLLLHYHPYCRDCFNCNIVIVFFALHVKIMILKMNVPSLTSRGRNHMVPQDMIHCPQ